MVTVAMPPVSSVRVTMSPLTSAVSLQPPRVSITCLPPSSLIIFWTSAAMALAPTTWQVRILVSMSLFSGFSSVSTVPAGRASKAALVGANTVKGPSPCRVSTRPAACTAATSVVWSFEFTAFSTMFLSANIAAPPTIGLSCADAVPAVAKATQPANSTLVIEFM